MDEVWKLIFNPPHAVRPIVGLILVVVIVAVGLILRQIMATAVSFLSLRRAREAASETKGNPRTVFAAICHAVEPSTAKPAKNSLRRLLNESQELAQRGLLQEQPGQLNELQNRDEEAVGAFPRYAASTCVLLGLLGTVVGMTVSIAELLPTLEATKQLEDPKHIIKQLERTLQGLRTAFGATLVGILGTVLVSFGNMLSLWIAQVVAAQRERFLVTVVHPLLVSAYAPETQLIGAAEKLQKASQQFANAHRALNTTAEQLYSTSSDLQGVSNTCGEAVATLSATAKKLEEASNLLAPVLVSAEKAIKQADLSDERAEKLYHQLVTKMNELAQSIRDLVTQHELSAERLREAVEEMYEKNTRAQSVLDNLATDSHSLLRGLVSANGGLLGMLEEVQRTVGELLREIGQANRGPESTLSATHHRTDTAQSGTVSPTPTSGSEGRYVNPQPFSAQRGRGEPPPPSPQVVWWNPLTWFKKKSGRRRWSQ